MNTQTSERRELEISAALSALDCPESLEALRELASRPRDDGELAYRLEATPTQAWELMTGLFGAGLVERWGPRAWKLTQLGAEVWSAVEPLLNKAL